ASPPALRASGAPPLRAILRRWALARPGDPAAAVALDGEVLKGSGGGRAPGLHLLAAFVPATAAVLGHLPVAASTNAHQAAWRLLGVLPLAGKGVPGDALCTPRDGAGTVRGGGGAKPPGGQGQPPGAE